MLGAVLLEAHNTHHMLAVRAPFSVRIPLFSAATVLSLLIPQGPRVLEPGIRRCMTRHALMPTLAAAPPQFFAAMRRAIHEKALGAYKQAFYHLQERFYIGGD